DYPTIQQGIDASVEGDTVLVQPGTYVENVNFNGHNIVLGSLFLTTGDTSYIEQTVIDGGWAGSVISFVNNENNTAIIEGFGIQHGLSQFGAGIYCYGASPLIISNKIRNNTANSEWDGFGGGIFCGGNSAPIIAYNTITDNGAGGVYYGEGGGISTQSFLSPIIISNLITGNSCSGTYGGAGGGICSFSESIMINNSVIDNHASGGVGPDPVGGIYCGDHTSSIINCIVRDNFHGDLTGTANASYCNIQDTLWPGIGNISIDPLFRDPDNGDFHLMAIACGDSTDSPCIDAGDPNILDSLLDCSWGLGGLRSDMGAYGGGDSLITAIFEDYLSTPRRFILMQNYPNPFNVQTNIRFLLPEPQDVHLTVYDLLGRQIRTLLDERKQAGVHTTTFDASLLSSGVYFYRLQTGDEVETKRMILLK
ncbi:MAG: T9SS type A sorting domain-containing protein, partial [Candidatus Zixiibacteriota bacterium]